MKHLATSCCAFVTFLWPMRDTLVIPGWKTIRCAAGNDAGGSVPSILSYEHFLSLFPSMRGGEWGSLLWWTWHLWDEVRTCKILCLACMMTICLLTSLWCVQRSAVFYLTFCLKAFNLLLHFIPFVTVFCGLRCVSAWYICKYTSTL